MATPNIITQTNRAAILTSIKGQLRERLQAKGQSQSAINYVVGQLEDSIRRNRVDSFIRANPSLSDEEELLGTIEATNNAYHSDTEIDVSEEQTEPKGGGGDGDTGGDDTKQQQIQKNDEQYLKDVQNYEAQRKKFGSYQEALSRATSNQAILEEFRNEIKTQIKTNSPTIPDDKIEKMAQESLNKVTAAQIQQRKEARLQQTRDQAQAIEQEEDRILQANPNIRQRTKQSSQLQSIKPKTNSDSLERDVVLGGTKASDLTSGEVKNLASERNPYKLIGIKREYASSQNLQAAYRNRLSQLTKSSDPQAEEALRNLRSTYPIFDSITEQTNTRQVQNRGDRMVRERAKARAQTASEELQRTRNIWQEGKKGNPIVDLKSWHKNQKKRYDKKKGEFLRESPWLLLKGAALVPAAAEIVGETAPAKYISRKTKAGVAKVGRSVATSRPAQWAGKTKIGRWSIGAGKWTGRLPKRVTQRISSIDERIGDYIGRKFDKDVTYKRFTPRTKAFRGRGKKKLFKVERKINLGKEYAKRKKKSKSKGLMAMGMGTRMYVGRILNKLNNVRRIVQNGAYTMSGLKSLNNGSKALSKSLTNFKTRAMGGAVGKGLIGAQKALNGVRAMSRATGAGLRFGAVGAGLALAMGGGAPAILGAAAFSGATGTLVKLTTDTLNSTKLSPFGAVQNLQKRFGVLGQDIKMQGLQGPAPAITTTKAMTFFKSLNTGFYGLAAGTLVATLLGAGPVVALLAGATTAGVATAARYAAGRAAVNASAKIAASTSMTALAKLPFFELVGIAGATPWINSQITALRSQGIKGYLGSNWSPTHLKSWLNYLKGAELGFNIGGTVGSIRALSSALGARSLLVGGGITLGTLAGIGLASLLGVPIGVGMIVGGTVGGIAGGFLGGTIGSGVPIIGTTFGAFLGSTFLGAFGSWVGSLYDKIFGSINILQNVLSALSLAKTLLDFVNALTKKFDPTAAFGLAFALIMMGTILVDLGFDEMNTNTTSRPAAAGVQDIDDDASRIKGKMIEIVTIDCLENPDGKVYNPSTSIVTRILKSENAYEIQTQHNIFKNITEPEYIVKDSTLSRGTLVGTCDF